MKFVSKFKNLRMVLKSSKTALIENSIVTIPGKTVEFKDFKYETTDKEEIKSIKASKTFGIDVFEDKDEKAGAE